MANFDIALAKILKNEGGYANDVDDPGGETFKGIARNMHPQWKGWVFIDKKDFNNPSLEQLVSEFYKNEFWEPIQGELINNQEIAETIFDFAVNAGVKISIGLSQLVVKVSADGISGPNTIAAINACDATSFTRDFALAKIFRYISICKKRPTSRKYFFGWVCRALEE